MVGQAVITSRRKLRLSFINPGDCLLPSKVWDRIFRTMRIRQADYKPGGQTDKLFLERKRQGPHYFSTYPSIVVILALL